MPGVAEQCQSDVPKFGCDRRDMLRKDTRRGTTRTRIWSSAFRRNSHPRNNRQLIYLTWLRRSQPVLLRQSLVLYGDGHSVCSCSEHRLYVSLNDSRHLPRRRESIGQELRQRWSRQYDIGRVYHLQSILTRPSSTRCIICFWDQGGTSG
jgi:hypothetical protein